MSVQTAHNIEDKQRTDDIQVTEDVAFTSMMISEHTLSGLAKSGFKKPSPIQLKAIPFGICGYDLIIKAKSGTGKTAVFGIIALELVDVSRKQLQALILAPTREIAVQIQQVILSIGSEIDGLKVEYFIGGMPFKQDLMKLQGCHIAVGAPGRVKHLIDNGALKTKHIRLFVLDEADQLMLESYQSDVNYIYNKLPKTKQMLAASATYPKSLDTFLSEYMLSPSHISAETQMPVLLGLKQFVTTVKAHPNVIQQMKIKTDELVRILSKIVFTQCLVFSNYQSRAESLSNNLSQRGWPSIFVSGVQNQSTRLNAVTSLKEFRCRILSATDLLARGIDADKVDLVINFDVPQNAEAYLHRMGRAGRYGSYGICITIATEGKDVDGLQTILGTIGGCKLSVARLPDNDDKFPKDICNCDVSEYEQLHGVIAEETEGNDTDTPIADLSKLLMDDEPDANVNSIQNILDDIHDQDVLNEKLIISKCDKLDYKSILKNLAQGHQPTEIPSGENLKKNSPNKSIKYDEKLRGENGCVELENKVQDTNILEKNVALYNITKFLIDDISEVNIDCAKDVEILLRSINIGQRESAMDNTAEVVQSDIPQWVCTNVSEVEDKIDETCTCPEDIFIKSFDYIMGTEKKHWKEYLCDQHQNTQMDNEVKSDVEQSNDEEYDDYYDEPYDEEPEPNENLSSKELSEENTPIEEYGYVTKYIHPSTLKKHNKRFPKHKRLSNKRKHETDTTNHPIATSDYPPHYNFDYSSRFEYLNNILMQNGPHFRSTAQFDDWFHEWQTNVFATREYIRNDIYAKEMLERKRNRLESKLYEAFESKN